MTYLKTIFIFGCLLIAAALGGAIGRDVTRELIKQNRPTPEQPTLEQQQLFDAQYRSSFVEAFVKSCVLSGLTSTHCHCAGGKIINVYSRSEIEVLRKENNQTTIMRIRDAAIETCRKELRLSAIGNG